MYIPSGLKVLGESTSGSVLPVRIYFLRWCLASASILPTIIYALAKMSAVLIGDPDKPLRQVNG